MRMSSLPPFTTVPTTQPLRIELGARSYSIVLGQNLLAHSTTWAQLPAAHTALIVTNDVVGPLYAQILERALQAHHPRVLVHTLPDGEEHKDWQHLQTIFDTLLRHQADRHTVLYALGGGVVGDMTGFAAACTCAACHLFRSPPRCCRRSIHRWAVKRRSIMPWEKT